MRFIVAMLAAILLAGPVLATEGSERRQDRREDRRDDRQERRDDRQERRDDRQERRHGHDDEMLCAISRDGDTITIVCTLPKEA